MINDNTILSSFDDKPTLLEWLKKVEDALKSDTATAVSVENPEPNTYVFKITFADGNSISSGNVVFPNAVQDVSIKNEHIIVTQISGTQTDLGAINPYAETIVENAETDTTEIRNNVSISGNVATGGNLGVTGQAVVGGRLQVNSSIISNGEIRGGNISGTKFLLGTEEMPMVKANPTGEATETLEKIKIGNVAYKVGGGGGITKRTLTIPASELTPSPADTKKAFFPASRNAFFDSLFEVNGYQSLLLTYKNNEGFMNVPLEVSTILTGTSKTLVYAAPSQQLTLIIEKSEGNASYFFTTGAEIGEVLSLFESFEFIVID